MTDKPLRLVVLEQLESNSETGILKVGMTVNFAPSLLTSEVKLV